MAQTYPLDPVIRLVSDDHRVSSFEETIVVVDPENNKAIRTIDKQGEKQLEKVKFFQRRKAGKNLLVISGNGNEAEDKVLGVPLRDFRRQWSIDLEVSYLASCNRGDEVKLAETLSPGVHPGAVLHNLIRQWIKEYGSSSPEVLIENYYSSVADLEAHISKKAREDVGLRLQATIRIEHEDKALDAIEAPPTNIPVRLRDYNEKQNLRLKTEVGVDEDRRIFAILYKSEIPKFEGLVKTTIQEYFATNVSLQEFHTQLLAPAFKQPLLDRLNSVLRSYGRKINYLTLEGQIKAIDDFREFSHDVRYRIQEYKSEIVIKNAVQMTLQDYARYKTVGPENLEIWVKENLDEVVRQVLFDKKYIDLLIGFDRSATEIKLRFTARAATIGYSIKQLITGPDLPPYEWLKNFTVKVDHSFEIRYSKFPVRLSIVITARINALEDIEKYLNHQLDIPSEMSAAVVDEAEQFLHTIDPERFYLRFSFTERDEGGPVDQILEEKIRCRLHQDFKATIVTVTVDMGETALTLLYNELRKTPGEFNVALRPYEANSPYDVVYSGHFRIETIHYDHWDKFQSSDPTIAGIKEHLEKHLKAELSTLPHEELAYRTREQQKRVTSVIEKLACERILSEFGLVIAVSMVSRQITRGELGLKEQTRTIYELGQVEAQERIEEVIRTISKLKSERLELMVGDADAAEIKKKEEKIKELEIELPINAPPPAERFQLLAGDRPFTPTTLAEFYDEPLTRTPGLLTESSGNENNGNQTNGNKETE